MSQPRSLPPPPQTQAHFSSTFKAPPLDGTLTIAQIYDWHFLNTPNHPLFVYARDDGSTRTIYWPEAVRAVYAGAKFLRDRFKWTAGTGEMPVVGVLASSGLCQLRRRNLINKMTQTRYNILPRS